MDYGVYDDMKFEKVIIAVWEISVKISAKISVKYVDQVLQNRIKSDKNSYNKGDKKMEINQRKWVASKIGVDVKKSKRKNKNASKLERYGEKKGKKRNENCELR